MNVIKREGFKNSGGGGGDVAGGRVELGREEPSGRAEAQPPRGQQRVLARPPPQNSRIQALPQERLGATSQVLGLESDLQSLI